MPASKIAATPHIVAKFTRNHREEIGLALAGGAPDQVPFTIYDDIFHPRFEPARLRRSCL